MVELKLFIQKSAPRAWTALRRSVPKVLTALVAALTLLSEGDPVRSHLHDYFLGASIRPDRGNGLQDRLKSGARSGRRTRASGLNHLND